MRNEEAKWLARALDGDEAAFGRLVKAYQVPVFNLCYRMLGDMYEAEDAAQETFFRAFQALKRFDPQRSFTNWLLSIASHHSIDRLRRKRLQLLPLEGLAPSDRPRNAAPGPEGLVIQDEEESRVREILGHLRPADRAAIVLRYWHDLSYEEIAASLSTSVSGVKSRLHRARRNMAERWLQSEVQDQRA